MESKQALNEFLDLIRESDYTFLDPDMALDEQGKVDGYQHFFHLLQLAVDFYLFNDPLRPQWMPLANANRRIYGDNVDAVYYFTQVRGDQEYIIRAGASTVATSASRCTAATRTVNWRTASPSASTIGTSSLTMTDASRSG